MKKIFYLVLSALFFSCTDNLENIDSAVPEGAVELTGVEATIVSGSPQTRVIYLPEAISRYKFVNNDRMTLTTIKRTEYPLAAFTYSGVEFVSDVNGTWARDKNTGTIAGGDADQHPDRVYWSDAAKHHTFIGFSLPKAKLDAIKANTPGVWNCGVDNVYHGEIGVGLTEINYNPETPETEDIIVKDNDGNEKPETINVSSKMKAEDILLTYSTTMVSDLSVAKLKFYHALSSIKVQVNLSNFYGSEIDGYTEVYDMTLLDQPTKYKWMQTGVEMYPESATHKSSSSTSEDNSPKDMILWNYNTAGFGSGASKYFTFFGITVPQDEAYLRNNSKGLTLSFKVKYPNPMKNDIEAIKKGTQTSIIWADPKAFTATIPLDTKPVLFLPGQCTIITINLSHQDDQMTIGAEYMDWQFIETPDEGNLKKNSTFMSDTDRTKEKVTIANDGTATADDATWLYYSDNENKTGLLDIYGNTGSQENPFVISTAKQLLSFAYEVNGGRSFEGLYIKLDAGITMQPSASLTQEELRRANASLTEIENAPSGLSWIGIGSGDNVFNGTFLGAGRKISRLMGEPLFTALGPNAVVEHLSIFDPLTITSTGTLTASNAGKVEACVVDGDVKSSVSGAGSLIGTNSTSGSVIACYHIGNMEGTGIVSGLVGTNSGTLIGCYNAGTIKGGTTVYGVANGGTLTGCFYNSDLAKDVTSGGVDKSTIDMQKASFVNGVAEVSHLATEEDVAAGKAENIGDKVIDIPAQEGLNTILRTSTAYRYTARSAAYPIIQ